MLYSKRLAKIAAALTATTAMAGYGVAYADASNNTVTVVNDEDCEFSNLHPLFRGGCLR